MLMGEALLLCVCCIPLTSIDRDDDTGLVFPRAIEDWSGRAWDRVSVGGCVKGLPFK